MNIRKFLICFFMIIFSSSLLNESQCGSIEYRSKSTQVPQFLLDAMLSDGAKGAAASLLCTQPRRLAAIGVAERVAAERG